jgi:coenzyme PQQ precursor peptide PqqA
MTWSTPTIREICLGMEINMYFPADEHEGEVF